MLSPTDESKIEEAVRSVAGGLSLRKQRVRWVQPEGNPHQLELVFARREMYLRALPVLETLELTRMKMRAPTGRQVWVTYNRYPCVCGMYEPEHVNGKCLFDAGSFKPQPAAPFWDSISAESFFRAGRQISKGQEALTSGLLRGW